MLLIGEGQADLALVLGDTAADALAGEADFEEPVDACALGNLYDNYTPAGDQLRQRHRQLG
jgi:uncharacterized protein